MSGAVPLSVVLEVIKFSRVKVLDGVVSPWVRVFAESEMRFALVPQGPLAPQGHCTAACSLSQRAWVSVPPVLSGQGGIAGGNQELRFLVPVDWDEADVLCVSGDVGGIGLGIVSLADDVNQGHPESLVVFGVCSCFRRSAVDDSYLISRPRSRLCPHPLHSAPSPPGTLPVRPDSPALALPPRPLPLGKTRTPTPRGGDVLPPAMVAAHGLVWLA